MSAEASPASSKMPSTRKVLPFRSFAMQAPEARTHYCDFTYSVQRVLAPSVPPTISAGRKKIAGGSADHPWSFLQIPLQHLDILPAFLLQQIV